MNKTPLKQFLANRRQADLSAAIGLTQGAISKMLQTGRDVYVVTDADGSPMWLVEEKRIPPAAPGRVA